MEELLSIAKMITVIVGMVFVPSLTRKFVMDLGMPVAQGIVKSAALATGGAAWIIHKKAAAPISKVALGVSSAPFKALAPFAMGSLSKNITTPIFERMQSPSENSLVHNMKKKAAVKLEKADQWLREGEIRKQAQKSGVEVPSVSDKIKERFSSNPQTQRALKYRNQEFDRFREGFQAKDQREGPYRGSASLGTIKTKSQGYYNALAVGKDPLRTKVELKREAFSPSLSKSSLSEGKSLRAPSNLHSRFQQKNEIKKILEMFDRKGGPPK